MYGTCLAQRVVDDTLPEESNPNRDPTPSVSLHVITDNRLK